MFVFSALFCLQKKDADNPGSAQIAEFENAVMLAERRVNAAVQQAAQQARDKRDAAIKAQVCCHTSGNVLFCFATACIDAVVAVLLTERSGTAATAFGEAGGAAGSLGRCCTAHTHLQAFRTNGAVVGCYQDRRGLK